MPFKQICGLWLGETKNGSAFYKGTLKGERKEEFIDVLEAAESVKLMIFKNSRKRNKNDPDANLMRVVEDEDPGESESPLERETKESTSDDDIPF